MGVPRLMLALLAAGALPLIGLVVWFTWIDSPGVGEDRCASCGVEDYVIAAFALTAAWLGALVARTAAAARISPRVTAAALGGVALFVLASLAEHNLFSLPAFAAMLLSVVVAPLALIWLPLRMVRWWRRPPSDDAAPRAARADVLAAWLALIVLLPGLFAWVWLDRVAWLTF